MDYSSIHEDTDNAGINSPWATSPQRSKLNFDEIPAAKAPPSPTSALPQSSYPARGADLRASSDQQDSSAREAPNGQAKGYDARSETTGLPYEQDHRPQQPQPRTQGMARPQPQQRQPSQRSTHEIPRYRLQAKLTGLERQGRKDPILRFDVYVCTICPEENTPRLTFSSD